jgi:membrane fusion protein, heavy metal efflux system
MKPFRWILIFAAAALTVACGRVGNADNRAVGGAQVRQRAASEDDRAYSKESKSSTEIVLTPAQQADFGIVVEAAHLGDQPEILEVPGEINLTDNGHWHIGVLASGRIEQVNVNLGDFVHEGDLLARMHSHDVHEARAAYQTSRSDLTRAQAAANLARVNYDRAQRLYELKAGSLSELDRARQELANAQASVHDEQIELEKNRIHLEGNLGVPADPASGVSEDEADLIPIRAVGAGYVLVKNITPGTVVDQTKDLFIIADLRRVWMIASVNEANISKVRLGEAATVKTNAFPMESFYGRVTNLSPELDPVTRAMRVRIELENPEAKLRGEMLATARIPVGPPKPVFTVAGEAIQQINDSDVVFVRKSEDHFEVRPVRLGDMFNGRVVLLEGVKPGEAIVAHGSFLLKSELLKSSIEER